MNTANFVLICGMILTYMIVLLQFKLSAETDDDKRFHFNIKDMPGLLGDKTLEDFLSFADNKNATLADWHSLRRNGTAFGRSDN